MFNKHNLHKQYQNNIAFRYLSIATIFLMVIQLIISGIQNKRVYHQTVNRLADKIDTYAEFLSHTALNSFVDSDVITLDNLAQSANQDIDVVYTIFLDKEQKTLAYKIEKDFLQIVKKQEIKSLNDLINKIQENPDIKERTKPIIYNNNQIGEVKLGYSLVNSQKRIHLLNIFDLYYAILVSGLFATMTLIIFHSQILHPLKQMQKLAKEFASGNFSQRIYWSRKDEIGKLGEALNSMASQLEYSLSNLDKVMDEALMAEKAKSQFLGKMSHELKTPLNGIIGFAQLMQQDDHTTQEQLENLTIIEERSLHLLDLINNVLEITRIDSGQSNLNYSKFDFYEFLKSIEQIFSFKAQEKHLKLTFKIDESIPQYIESDEQKLKKIIANLLDNSIKFTNQGQITLKVKKKIDNNNITYLYFKISDTGKGISSKEIDALFVAFAQTESGEKTIKGMGLGLPMSRQFIQLMGGDISIKSEINQGTIIRFSIPLEQTNITGFDLQESESTEWESFASDSIESQFFQNPESSYDLTKQKLATMPSEWLLALQESTIKVDNDLIFAVLERIPNQDEELKQALINLIDNFRYDSILELTDDALGKNTKSS